MSARAHVPASQPGSVWTGTLPALREVLLAEAAARPGRWHWRALVRGAVVAVKRTPQLTVWRVARQGAPLPRSLRARWRHELAVFAEHLRIEETPHQRDVVKGNVIAHLWAVPHGNVLDVRVEQLAMEALADRG